MQHFRSLPLTLILAALAAPAHANETVVVLHTSISEFIDKTCAVAQGDYPPAGQTTDAIGVGELSIAHAAAATELFVAEWTSLLEGDDLALSADEEMDLWVDEPITSFGFEIVEATVPGLPPGCNYPVCLDSTFELSLFLGPDLVGAVQFNAPDEQAAFIGVHSNKPFDRMELRELTPDPGNEYFGELFIGRCQASVNYGQGTPGTGGFTPTLLPPPLAPKAGTTTAISATGILGGAPTLLAIGTAPQSLQVAGIELLVDEPTFLTVAPPGTPWVPGDGAFDLPLQIPGGDMFVGLTFYLQVIVLDDGGPAFGYASSPGLELTFCAGT